MLIILLVTTSIVIKISNLNQLMSQNKFTPLEEDYFSKVAAPESLIEAFHKTGKISKWKASTQRYASNLLYNVGKYSKLLLSGEYQQKPFYEFLIHERGKVRYVRSLHISDRVVQRSLCDNCLVKLYKYCIYDNGASQLNKGLSFTRERFKCHLEKYLRTHSNIGSDDRGYILFIDFKKFFDNIPHKEVVEMFQKYIKDERIINLVSYLIDTFKIDVSYLSDEEYEEVKNSPFNLVEHFIYLKSHPNALQNGTKYLHKSLGIGEEISQIAGVLYPVPIDNYCKIVKQCKYYGRYMDDIYIIHEDKKFLEDLLQDIINIAKELKLYINIDKSHIVPINKPFSYLHYRYYIKNNRVNIKLQSKSIRRELKKLLNGPCTIEDLEKSFNSWYGTIKKYISKQQKESLLNKYNLAKYNLNK